MEDLADHSYADISMLVDVYVLGSVMENAGFQGNIDLIDAIADSLSDDAQATIPSYAWASIIELVADAPAFNPGVTQEAANAQVREIMEDLADHSYADISMLVDMGQMNTTVQNLATNDNFDAVDAVLDNLSANALTSIDTAALAASDVAVGSDSSDIIWGLFGGSEALYGLDGNDLLIGGSGDTALYGGDGNDYLYDLGGNGDDTISGGDGSDQLYGGSGADTFVFREGETGVDTVLGFNSGAGDRLDITNYLDQFDPLQDAINDFVILTESNGSTTVSIDVDGAGSGTAQDIAVLRGSTGLDITDVIDVDTGIIV